MIRIYKAVLYRYATINKTGQKPIKLDLRELDLKMSSLVSNKYRKSEEINCCVRINSYLRNINYCQTNVDSLNCKIKFTVTKI